MAEMVLFKQHHNGQTTPHKHQERHQLEGHMKSIITITRPVLTPEERAKRMEEIKRAAVDLVLATERCTQERNLKNAKTSRKS